MRYFAQAKPRKENVCKDAIYSDMERSNSKMDYFHRKPYQAIYTNKINKRRKIDERREENL